MSFVEIVNIMAKRITILDIAEHAGVSYQTVSRVINNKPDVAAETRLKVEAAIKELGYFPSTVAQSMRSKRTRTIGLVVPDNANPFFAELAKGVEDAGFEAGYTVILCNSNKVPARELAYLEVLQSKGVDGIIFIATTAHTDQIEPLVERGIPIVMFYRDSGQLDVDVFKVDNAAMGFAATSHLIAFGHRTIACIQPASPNTPSRRRVDGYLRALTENGLTPTPDLMTEGNNLVSGGEESALRLLQSAPPFTAIYAANDAMAIGAMRGLRSQGLRIPHDVSIVGTDDITLAAYVEPPLTTIAQPKQSAGQQAVHYLIERIEGKHTGGPREVLLETQLVSRGSCAAPRLN